MKRLLLMVSLLVATTACAIGPADSIGPKLPYNAWSIGLAAPRHMEVWVERIDVLDTRGRAYLNVFGGVVSYTGKPEGWHKGGGKTKPINNVDLPEQISLRWQSLVEPQTYRLNIIIPQWVRDEMLRPEKMRCIFDEKESTYYRNTISLGMAPGGIVKMFVGVGCLGYKEVGRFQAEIEPLGPHRNGSGIYYRAPTPAAQNYIDTHGIPYGTW